MKKLWEKYADIVTAILSFLAFAVIVVLLLTSCNAGLKREIEQLREELARQQQYVPLHRDTIRDSVEVVTQKIVEVQVIKEVLTDEDRKLLKDVGISAKELMSLQNTGMETKDSVSLSAKDSSENAPLYYKDAWAEFEFHDRKLKYSVRDSLAIAVKREYKHRLLWFRWGTKGYDLKVVNFNPHARVIYNRYIKAGK